MYTILINDSNELITTVSHAIMQRSKLVDDLIFLTRKYYNGHDMSEFTVTMEYILPASRRYRSETLVMKPEMYGEFLQYELPFDTRFTSEPGDIEINITFSNVYLDSNGENIQRVRKIAPSIIKILPITAWSDIIPDDALTALDQRIIKIDSQIKALDNMNQDILATKADGIAYSKNDGTLQLTADGALIGNIVELEHCLLDSDGIPVVEFKAAEPQPEDPELVDVVLF